MLKLNPVAAAILVLGLGLLSEERATGAGIFCRGCQTTYCVQPDICCRLELQECQRHVGSLNSKVAGLEKCLKICEEEKASLTKELAAIRKELAKVKAERGKLIQQVAELEKELKECEGKLRAALEHVREIGRAHV